MRRIGFLVIAVAMLASVIAYVVPAHGQADKNSAEVYVRNIPAGYRDWKMVSVAHEAGNLNSIGVVLGNDIAIKAYRDQKLPFPDGSMIAALHYTHSPNEENDKIFGQQQSFTPGAPTNIQFMIKDSKKYAATGGWGFGHFGADGKPGADTAMKTCGPCHAMATRDGVFTRYAP
jgi:hypothetical protein